MLELLELGWNSRVWFSSLPSHPQDQAAVNSSAAPECNAHVAQGRLYVWHRHQLGARLSTLQGRGRLALVECRVDGQRAALLARRQLTALVHEHRKRNVDATLPKLEPPQAINVAHQEAFPWHFRAGRPQDAAVKDSAAAAAALAAPHAPQQQLPARRDGVGARVHVIIKKAQLLVPLDEGS